MAHPRWPTSTHKFLVLYYYTIQQNEGMHPTTTALHFLFTLLQSLSHNHIDNFTMIEYNTIYIRIPIPSFYKGNTMGKYHRMPKNMGP